MCHVSNPLTAKKSSYSSSSRNIWHFFYEIFYFMERSFAHILFPLTSNYCFLAYKVGTTEELFPVYVIAIVFGRRRTKTDVNKIQLFLFFFKFWMAFVRAYMGAAWHIEVVWMSLRVSDQCIANCWSEN